MSEYRGWVYDFSTEGGAFVVGGLVVKNCRRVASPRPDITSAEHARTAEPIGPQFTAEQIATAHANPSVDSPAAARARARVAKRTSTGTLVLERTESKAARSNAARVRKRTGPAAGRP